MDTSGADAFPPYDVNADTIRTAAEEVRGNDLGIRAVLDAIGAEHAVAAAAVEGELAETVASMPQPAQAEGQAVRQQLVWAAAQLEMFADAVAMFDVGSVDPPAVRTLNAMWRFCQRTYFTMPPEMYLFQGPIPAAPPEPAEQQAYTENSARYWNELRGHYVRLEGQLDEAAAEVARNLDTGPTTEGLRLAWAAGNLPTEAPLIWPDAGLTLDILGAVPADYDQLTDEELAAMIRENPAFDPGLYAALVALRPGLLPALNDAYRSAGGLQPSGNEPTLIGPDGLPYPVGVPSFPPPPPGEQAMGPALPPLYAAVCGGPFATVAASPADDIYLGDPTMRGQTLAWTLFLSGASPQLPPDADPRSPQPQAPYGGPQNPLDPSNPLNRPTGADAAGTAVDLVVAVAEAYAVAEAIEDEQTYAYQVFYQVDDDGARRAVIVMTQANADGSVTQCYGRIDENGDVVPA